VDSFGGVMPSSPFEIAYQVIEPFFYSCSTAPIHYIIAIGSFTKWGIDFITSNPHSTRGHAYIILAVDYFTKWVEVMSTFSADGKIAATFIFNHIISRFSVPQAIITDHGSHF